ncbi:unnamed protein product [Cochlearia groenlandica]
MTGDAELLTEMHEIPRSIIVLPNGKHSYATKEGSFHLGGDRVLRHMPIGAGEEENGVYHFPGVVPARA